MNRLIVGVLLWCGVLVPFGFIIFALSTQVWTPEQRSHALKPLAPPVLKQVDPVCEAVPAVYQTPTYPSWTCPAHGETTYVQRIRSQDYCMHCLWEKVLDR